MFKAIIAILGAGLAGWIFGAVWYTALGKPWQRALGLNPDEATVRRLLDCIREHVARTKRTPDEIDLIRFYAQVFASAQAPAVTA